ncbi:MAG: c-type cytochrome [Betaproteobacteria bacterium]
MRPVPLSTLAVIAAWALPAFAQSPDTARDFAATCANCHGTNGVSRGGIESLAGKSKTELAAKLQEFKQGKRPGTIMPQLARGFSDAQIESVAAWFAAQPSK